MCVLYVAVQHQSKCSQAARGSECVLQLTRQYGIRFIGPGRVGTITRCSMQKQLVHVQHHMALYMQFFVPGSLQLLLPSIGRQCLCGSRQCLYGALLDTVTPRALQSTQH